MKGFGKITLGDMKHIKELSKEQRRTFYALVAAGAVLLGGVGTTSVLAYQNQVQQEKLALEKKEYKALVSSAKKAVDTAYKTRKQTDINLAEKKVGQLKKTDKKTYTQKLTELKGYLSQVEKVNGLISKAEQSKSDADVTSAQKGIDEEKADYLKNDKKAHQTKLDALKKTIADEKAKKAEEEKQAQEAAAQAEAERQAQAAAQAEAKRQAQTQAQASNSSSNNSSSYSSGSSNASASTPSQAGQASQPAQGNSSNASSSSSSNNSSGGFTLDWEYPGRISPYFLSEAEAQSWLNNYCRQFWDKGETAGKYAIESSSCSDGRWRYYVTPY